MKFKKAFCDLPDKLEDDELNNCFERMKNGDMVARNKIIVHNARIVAYEIMEKFANTQYDLEDLFSVGIIGLIKSIDKFDINEKYMISSYAAKCVDNEILMYLRKK